MILCPSSITLATLLNRCRERGWITDIDFRALSGLRLIRNPYAHFRNWEHADGLLLRSIASGKTPEGLLELDAQQVIRALFNIVNRPPFALRLIAFPEDDTDEIAHPDQEQLPM